MRDGDWSSPGDPERERRERDHMPTPQARRAAEAAALREAQAAQQEAQAAQDTAQIERQLRAAFVGTEAEWQREKGDLIRQERHRLTAERDAAARQAQRATYQ